MKTIPTFVALALLCTPLRAQYAAFDGVADLEVGDSALEAFDYNASPEERALVEARFDLLADIELELMLARAYYRGRGYHALVPVDLSGDGRVLGRDVRNVQRHWRVAYKREAPEGVDQRLVARLILDGHLAVREDLVLTLDLDREELRGALALLHAAARGYGLLQPHDRRNVIERANLAACRLRAALQDLQELSQPLDQAASPHGDELSLSELFGPSSTLTRPEERQRIERWLEQDETRMRAGLLVHRFDQRYHQPMDLRRKGRERAMRMWNEINELVPFSPEGKTARPEIANMSQSDRFGRAMQLGIEAIELDPFNAWLRYMTAESLDFRSGIRASAAYFDHFLVLRGIRYYDYKTYDPEDLVFAEVRALDALQGFKR